MVKSEKKEYQNIKPHLKKQVLEIDSFLVWKKKKKEGNTQKGMMNFSLLPSVNFNSVKLSRNELVLYFENSVRQIDNCLASGHFTNIIILYKNKQV